MRKKTISFVVLVSFTISQLGLNYSFAFQKQYHLRAPNGTGDKLGNEFKTEKEPEKYFEIGEEYKNIRVKQIQPDEKKIIICAQNIKTEKTEIVALNIYPSPLPDQEKIIRASGNQEVIKKILKLLPENVSFYTLNNLIKDFVAFTSPDYNLIATHSSIADDPLAMNQQICAYLLKKGIIHLKLTDNILIVSDNRQNELGRINISQQTWNSFKGEKWAADWRNNPAYLLKLFQREIFGVADSKLANRISDFYYSIRYFRLNNYLILNPVQSPFSHLYAETKEIFDNLLKAAEIEGATLCILEDDTPTAFAYPAKNIVAISTGLFKLLKKEELTKDAVAFILAHELRHLQQRKAESRQIAFAKEMDSDVQALDLMNLAGYNVIEATKYFVKFAEIDKTAAINSKLGSVLTTALELADEHATSERRAEYLKELLDSANWLKTDTTTPFSDQAKAEINNQTELKAIIKKIEKIETFADLENLLLELPPYPEYINTIAIHGLIKIAKKMAKPDFYHHHHLLFLDDSVPEYILSQYLRSQINKENIKEFKDGYHQIRALVSSQTGSFNCRTLELALFWYGLSNLLPSSIRLLWIISREDSLKSQQMEGILSILRDKVKTLLENNKEISGFTDLKEFPVFHVPYALAIGPILNLNECLQKLYTKYLDYFWKKDIEEEAGLLPWHKCAEIVKTLDRIQEQMGNDVIEKSRIEFDPIVRGLLYTDRLTDREKIDWILEFPFLAFKLSEDTAKTKRPVNKYVVGFLFNNYKINNYHDKNMEKFLKALFVRDEDGVLQIITEEALAELKNGNPKLLNIFVGEQKISDRYHALNRMYSIWKRGKSEKESIEMLELIIKYNLKNSGQDFSGNTLFSTFYESLIGADKEVLSDELINNILKSAGIPTEVSKLNRTTKVLIYFFSRGAILDRGLFYQLAVEGQMADLDRQVLAKFLDSNYLLNLHTEYGRERKNRKRIDVDIKKIPDAEDVERVDDWSEYILFLNLRIFLENIEYRNIDYKLRRLQEVFTVFLTKIERKITSQPLPNSISDLISKKFFDAKNAEKEISEKYEPLFNRLFHNLPFYADRTYFFENRKEFFGQLFDFIFNSEKDFDELLSTIKTYLPPSPLTDFVLFSLFLRELQTKYPDKNTYNLSNLKKILDKDEAMLEKLEKISSSFTPDARLAAMNTLMWAYLIRKKEGIQKSGLGARDKVEISPKESDSIPIPTPKSFRQKVKETVQLLSYLQELLTLSIEAIFFEHRYLKRVKAIFPERQLEEEILERKNNRQIINSIVSNYYYEKILLLIYQGQEFILLRILILRYLIHQRIKQSIPKIDFLLFDFNHPNKLTQFDALSFYWQEKKIREKINSPESFENKLAYLCSLGEKQPARDQFLEILFNQEISGLEKEPNKVIAERLDLIRTNSDKFYQEYFINHYLLKTLKLERILAGDLSWSEEIKLIQKYFPKASYLRDDLLKNVLAKVEEPSDYYELIADLFYAQKRNILESDDKAKATFWEEKLKIPARQISRAEKKEFMLWILGIKAMPLFMREYEELQGVSYQRLKEIYALAGGSLYPYAGESLRNVLIQEMFLGKNGIFSDDKIFMEFMEEILNFVLKNTSLEKSISAKTVKKIFYAVMFNCNERKKLEIVKALAMNFGSLLQAGRDEKYTYTEVITKFMESMGIYGIKVGQIIASAGDINLPDELRLALENLTNQAKLLTKKVALETFRNYRIKTIKKLGKLLSAASIKIVYEAETIQGQKIAVKIKRPDVAHNLWEDSKIFKKICAFLRSRGLKIPFGFEDQASEGIKKDADFLKEIENTHKLEKQLPEINQENDYKLSSGRKVEFLVPKIFAGSNDKIIFTDLIGGEDLVNEKTLVQQGIVSEAELKELRRIIFDFLMTQLFSKGLYLADPHGGNFKIVRENGVIKVYLIDVGALESIEQDKYGDMLKSLAYLDLGLKLSDNRFILPALFFEKTGYLTKGTMDYDQILELIFSKIVEENKPFKNKEDFEKIIRNELIWGVYRGTVSIPQFLKILLKTGSVNLIKVDRQLLFKEKLKPVNIKKIKAVCSSI